MEQEIFTIRPSMKPIAVYYVLAVIVAVFVPFAPWDLLKALVGLISIAILFLALSMTLQRNFTVYKLTSENLRFRSGILGKRETIFPLARIQNVTFSLSFIQRLFKIGDIIVETAGEHRGDNDFLGIEKPEETAKKILDAIKNQKPGQV
jgi:uncharacterized membrane protein YdbT with pleckstrin-like domain